MDTIMKVQAIGHTADFSDLKPGDCYFHYFDGKSIFAFAGELNSKTVGLIFSEGAQQMPWVAFGGHPPSVLRVQDAIIRPDISSLAFGALEIGHLINAQGKFYVAASSSPGDRLTINLETGLNEVPSNHPPAATFSRWSVGKIVDEKWLPIYEFGFGG